MFDFVVGVDGGGTGTRVLLEQVDGRAPAVAGHAGPSALGQGIPAAWSNIRAAITMAAQSAAWPEPAPARCLMVCCLSGVSYAPWREAFLQQDPGFGKIVLETDAFAMLTAAHQGQPGVIVAAGTGSIAEAILGDGRRVRAGGWGFPVGDEGSGAWLGLQAVRLAQRALDGRGSADGELVRQVFAQCGSDLVSMHAWCRRAGAEGASGQRLYAEVAQAVFAAADLDPLAASLLGRAAAELAALDAAIDPAAALPLAVCGSVGDRLKSRLPETMRRRLLDVEIDPVQGALTLARLALQQTELAAQP